MQGAEPEGSFTRRRPEVDASQVGSFAKALCCAVRTGCRPDSTHGHGDEDLGLSKADVSTAHAHVLLHHTRTWWTSTANSCCRITGMILPRGLFGRVASAFRALPY